MSLIEQTYDRIHSSVTIPSFRISWTTLSNVSFLFFKTAECDLRETWLLFLAGRETTLEFNVNICWNNVGKENIPVGGSSREEGLGKFLVRGLERDKEDD